MGHESKNEKSSLRLKWRGLILRGGKEREEKVKKKHENKRHLKTFFFVRALKETVDEIY